MEDAPPVQPEATHDVSPAASSAAVSPPGVEGVIDLFCPACGYDLRGLETEACPECGAGVDLAQLRLSSIPWVLAQGFWGRVKGFLRTCERVMFKPARFSREVARPVSLKEARRFRSVVVGVVWLTLLAAAAMDWLLLVYAQGQADDWGDFFEVSGISEAWLYITAALLLLLFLVGFTGLHLYALHPKALPVERQNRAVALGHYACAPLAFLPFVLLIRVTGAAIAWVGEAADADWASILGMALWAVTWLLGPVLVFWFLGVILYLTSRSVHRSGLAQVGLALGVPLLWLVWALFVFAILPAGVLFVYLFFITG
ncbi:zinc ribbon domain-containing protein [Phycisphaeraceae bacterium D3-23]